MALDGIVTRAIVHDLQRCVGARIHKIHQPTEHELVLGIRGAGGGGRLLLSANPTYPRVHWSEASYVNPLEAPMFCMLMRKHCEGGVIEAIRQIGRERIIHIDVRHRDELGDTSSKTIIVEIMGRHSNIILTDSMSGLIHDGIHHVTPAISSHRIILPGVAYVSPPAQGKADPLEVDSEAQFLAILAASDAVGSPGSREAGASAPVPDGSAPDALAGTATHPEAASGASAAPVGGSPRPEAAPEANTPLHKRLVGAFSGLSPLLAKEIVYRAGSNAAGEPNMSAVWDSFRRLMDEARAGRYAPVIVTDAGSGRASFSVTRLAHIDGPAQSFETVSECLEAFYGDKAERDTVKQRAADLIRFVQNERAKNMLKVKKLQETLEEARDADKYRVLGELLTAYMHSIKRGDESVSLVNFYDENAAEVTIPLDPQLSPSENAQRYFRRYTKHRNSVAVVGEQMAMAEAEIRYFESLLQQLDNAALADIEEIRDELVQGGYMRERSRRGPRKKKALKPALLCYTSSEGVPVYVGKNNTQNEYLTNRLAAPSDTWLHTKDIPGSHVVIRGGDYGNATLEEAAMLAAHYSQARSSSMVPVDYTLIRHVRKPNGAKPGFVIYDNQKTLFITPDEARLKSLRSEIK